MKAALISIFVSTFLIYAWMPNRNATALIPLHHGDKIAVTKSEGKIPQRDHVEPSKPFVENRVESDPTNQPEINENKEDIEQAMVDMKTVEAHWVDYRDYLYKEILVLDPYQLRKIDELREHYESSFEAIADHMDGIPKDEKSEKVVNQLLDEANAFDSDVEGIIGKKKYDALLRWRDTFNEQAKDATKTHVEVNAFW